MKKKWFIWLIPALSLAVLILGAVPGSVVLRSMRDPAKNAWFYKKTTCYSLINIEYANIFPALTMVFSLIAGIKSLLFLLGKTNLKGLVTMSVAAMACACLTVYHGGETILAWVIFALLCVQMLLAWLLNGKRGDAV